MQETPGTGIPQIVRAHVNWGFRILKNLFGQSSFKLLDIGSGNNSATKITTIFPNCEYHGLDQTREYNYNSADFARMKAFYELDLTTLRFEQIPNDTFDIIWMVHVIEHLKNGDDVIRSLLPKLKNGGYLYVEYPGPKSLKLPSMPGSLNFRDDPTHVRVYSVGELSALLLESGCTIVRGGTRRNSYYILATPLRAVVSLIKRGRLEGNIFWDAFGFAEFVLAKKIK